MCSFVCLCCVDRDSSFCRWEWVSEWMVSELFNRESRERKLPWHFIGPTKETNGKRNWVQSLPWLRFEPSVSHKVVRSAAAWASTSISYFFVFRVVKTENCGQPRIPSSGYNSEIVSHTKARLSVYLLCTTAKWSRQQETTLIYWRRRN